MPTKKAKPESENAEATKSIEQMEEEVASFSGAVSETPAVTSAAAEQAATAPTGDEAAKPARGPMTINFGEQYHVHKQIQSILFGVLSPKMIKKMASTKIVTPELYDREGYPVDGGLMDIKLGVIDPGLKCKTCGCKLKECIGHFGYIELARPAIHIKFTKIIHLLLKTTCGECGRILIPQEKIEKSKALLDKIEREEGTDARRLAVKSIVDGLKSATKCPHCKAKKAKTILEKPTTFVEEDRRISPIEVRTRLEKVPDEDLIIYGMNPKTVRPEWMVLTVLPIPPVTMRPSITLETGERSEDDLTHKLGDIVRINQRLFENINAGAPEIIIEDLWDLLQYHVTTFFDNEVPQLPPARHRGGQPLKTLTERIKSKEGRIRHNLAGKRTNFCARTVISPDPLLKINEVGVPKVVAMKLTVPEVVQEWNKDYLKSFVSKGPGEYPGANYVIRPDGKKKKITEETKEAALEEIQPGYVVERHLMDGDIAIFNRQPSLHRMSMMCHRVKVLPYKTLRLNPAVCAPYNADFDGDEMNLHIPQSEEARAEAEVLMDVKTQLISPRYGLSIIGCTQDALSGNYFLTKYLDIPRSEAVALLATIHKTDYSRLPNKATVTGKEIFSCLLPTDFDFIGTDRADQKVEIRKGKLVDGIIDENTIGGEGAGIMLRSIHKQYGPERAIEILQDIYRLGNETLNKVGLTMTISDTDLPAAAKEQVDTILSEAHNEVQNAIQQFEKGTLEVYPGRTADETLEVKLLEILNRARNKVGQVTKANVDPKAQIKIMVDSGARGNITQLTQMAALVGQQALRGKRIVKGYRGRTLSCFRKGDLGAEAHGFVKNSFKKGLDPKEFFFHQITGRDGLMDTALRTPKSGYLYRRLANALQDVRVEYDSTVRDGTGKIVQFTYGEDNVDVARTENGKINIQRIIDTTE